jgi:Protein of unknown function (DUF3667)
MQPSNCLNCGQTLQNQSAFCPLCGQKTSIHRISFHELWHDVVHYFTHADKGIFILLKCLATQPGVIAREYIEGKRKKYFKPLNFYLVVAGILVFVTSFFYKPDEGRSYTIQQAALKTEDPVKKQQLLGVAERTRQISKITGKYSNVINMVAMPLLTVVFWLVYYKRKYNYVEHLVANMYFIGFIMLWYALVFFPLQSILPDKLSIVVLGLFFLFEILFRGYAYFQFINKKGAGAVIKAYGASVLLTVIWSGLTGFLIFYYVRCGFF